MSRQSFVASIKLEEGEITMIQNLSFDPGRTGRGSHRNGVSRQQQVTKRFDGKRIRKVTGHPRRPVLIVRAPEEDLLLRKAG